MSGQGPLGPSYHGVGFSGEWTYYDSFQDPYNPSSSPTRLYTLTDNSSIDFGSTVSFQGLYLSGYFSVTIDLLNNGATVFSQLYNSSNTPTLVANTYNGLIDQVVFHGNPDFWTIDDITYNGVNPVPAPGAVWLFGSGLMGLFGFKRRKQGQAIAV